MRLKLLNILVIFIIFLLVLFIFYVKLSDNLNEKTVLSFEQERFEQEDSPFIRNSITLSFVGDILLVSHVERKINQFGFDYPFKKVADLLASDDYTMGNLECPISIYGSPVPNKKYTFRANPKVLKTLTTSGVDILAIANNHILDYGVKAFKETLNHLKSQGLYYVGAGVNQEEAYKPLCLEKNGKKIAFFAASRVIPYGSWYAGKNQPGVAGVYNPDRLIQEMKKIRNKVDVIVVYLHWGVERESMPRLYQRKLGKLLIDNGADIVVGSHPHVLQGFEFYKNKLIAYSLGNFVFTNMRGETLILTVEFDDKGISSARIIPCVINDYRPEPILDANLKQRFYEKIEGLSYRVKVEEGRLINKN